MKFGFVSKDYVKNTSKMPKTKIYQCLGTYSATILNNNTNIRIGPSTSFAKVGKLNNSETVTVIGKINDFLVIIFR
ncbi:MAG: SH3 domain-containing protein [Clostridia bacterium]